MSEVVSVRVSNEIAERLRERAAAAGEAVSGLAQRLIGEGLQAETHPGIVFRPGPSGRRTGLMREPDVTEVVGLLRSLEVSGQAAITETAAWLDLTEAQVRTALGYYGAFPAEIDTQMAAQRSGERARTSGVGHPAATPRLKLPPDEMFPAAIAPALRTDDYDVVAVPEDRDVRASSDPALFAATGSCERRSIGSAETAASSALRSDTACRAVRPLK